MTVEQKISSEIEQVRLGKLLGKEVVAKGGLLEISDLYYGGNMGVGRHHPKESTLLKIGDETIIRRLDAAEDVNQPTAFVLSVPSGLHVSISMLFQDRFSSVAGKNVNYIYVPDGLQVHGKIGDTEFITHSGDDIDFGGHLTWGKGNNIGMTGHKLEVNLNSANSSAELGRTGIAAAKWQ